MKNIPDKPKIYHILHVDRLSSVLADHFLWGDFAMVNCSSNKGTVIGMNKIKQRRLNLKLTCYPDLTVGSCVPFYFCPRSIMLYIIHKGNHPELSYKGGQEPIIHLEADLYEAVNWAEKNNKRWVILF